MRQTRRVHGRQICQNASSTQVWGTIDDARDACAAGQVEGSSDEECSLNDVTTMTNKLLAHPYAAARFARRDRDEVPWLSPSGSTSPAKRGIDLMQSRLATNKHYLQHQREAKFNDDEDYGSAVESETTADEDEHEAPLHNYQAELETALISSDSPANRLYNVNGVDSSQSDEDGQAGTAGHQAARGSLVRRAKRNVVLRKPCRNQRMIFMEGAHRDHSPH